MRQVDDKEKYFEELREQKRSYVDGTLKYYTDRISRFQIAFRVTGTLIILGSVALPSLVHLPEPYRAPTVSVVSFLVAALAALNSFYSWHQTWEKYTRTILALEHFIANWEIDMVNAAREDYPKAKVDAYLATSHLFTKVFETVSGESKDYFSQVKPPQIEPPRSA
jgi:hypothetical protein